MTHPISRRAAIALPLVLGGCGLLDFFTDEERKPIPGAREPVLSPARGLQIDAVEDVSLPPAETNADWPQFFRAPNHVGGNLAGGLSRAWSAKIGAGGAYRTRLTTQPIVSGATVFTMDTNAAVQAQELATGRRLWRTETRLKKDRGTNIGGGISFADGTIYVATGRASLLALDAGSGRILWRTDLIAPARSAPTVAEDRLFVTTIDSQLFAFSRDGGHRIWSFAAQPTDTGMLAQGAPAYADGIVVAGFESGDISAVRADSGSLVWSDNLGAVKGTAGLAEFASVRGAPVIENGLVYAIGLGGLFTAIDLRSGRRIWERDISGENTPWLAGDTLFVISADQRLAAVNKRDGTVHWVTDLPRFKNPKRSKGLINWTGPALIGGKLIALSDNDHMAVCDPLSGQIVSNTDVDVSSSVTPVASQGIALILTDDGRLTAFK